MHKKVLRILDANINRAMEGLRVVEDIVRFVLEEKQLSLQLKNVRHEFKRLVNLLNVPLAARDSTKDLGRGFYVKGEKNREGLENIFKSNIKRCQEALRVIEEFSKLLNPALGKRYKEIRFKLYDLEKCIAGKLSKKEKLNFGLYVITDEGTAKKSHIQIASEAIAGGCKIIQLRDKTATKRKYFRYASAISKICKKVKVAFIVNDYPDICLAVDADGVHLGQDDLPISAARKILGDEKIIGASASNLKQAVVAEKEGADYIGFGPVFFTPLKPAAKGTGISLLKKVMRRVKIPVVAIGGIDENNINQLAKAGCRRVGIIRAIFFHPNIAKAVRNLRNKLH